MTLQNVVFSTSMYNCTIDTSQLFSPILREALVDLGQRAVIKSFELFLNSFCESVLVRGRFPNNFS